MSKNDKKTSCHICYNRIKDNISKIKDPNCLISKDDSIYYDCKKICEKIIFLENEYKEKMIDDLGNLKICNSSARKLIEKVKYAIRNNSDLEES